MLSGWMDGGSGDDKLFAGFGDLDDTLIGGEGSDDLGALGGNNILYGGGADGLGDSTRDDFVFSSNSGGGTNTIMDFEPGTDKVYLLDYTYSNYADAVSNGVLVVTQDGDDQVWTLNDGTVIRFVGISGDISSSSSWIP